MRISKRIAARLRLWAANPKTTAASIAALVASAVLAWAEPTNLTEAEWWLTVITALGLLAAADARRGTD